MAKERQQVHRLERQVQMVCLPRRLWPHNGGLHSPKERNQLPPKGHLEEILRRKIEKSKENNQDDHKIPEKSGSPPFDAKIIDDISGGSKICGASYSQAKRHAKVSKIEKKDRPQKNTMVSSEKEITFDETDREGIQDPHHE